MYRKKFPRKLHEILHIIVDVITRFGLSLSLPIKSIASNGPKWTYL